MAHPYPLTAETDQSINQIRYPNLQKFIRKYWSVSPFAFLAIISLCNAVQAMPANDEYGIHERAFTSNLLAIKEKLRKDSVTETDIEMICDGIGKCYSVIEKIQTKLREQ
jgi:hypothetical protein